LYQFAEYRWGETSPGLAIVLQKNPGGTAAPEAFARPAAGTENPKARDQLRR